MQPLAYQIKQILDRLNTLEGNQNCKEYTLNGEGWYRIGEFNYNTGATGLISFNVIAGSNNSCGILKLSAIKGFDAFEFNKVSYMYIGTPLINKFRLVLKNYSICYIEVYKTGDTSITLQSKLANEIGIKLYEDLQEGNVPSDYIAKELNL